MRTPALLRAAAAALLVVGGALAVPTAANAASGRTDDAVGVQHPCGTPRAGRAACLVEVVAPAHRARVDGARAAEAEPIRGYSPHDIALAYQLRGGGTGTIGIVDAYDDPRLAANLAAYRAHWGLPACTVASHCLTKANQRGSTAVKKLPDADAGWGVEESLDVDAASAACPHCRILIVEADSDSDHDLGTAENTAVRLGAAAVSNSFGGLEVTGVQKDGTKYYDHPHVPLLAATGDDGFPAAISPATEPHVIAVGGTTLTRDRSVRSWGETAWASGGSGCSAYTPKPSWQHDAHCPMRAVADVAADADPETGLAIYDTFGTGEFSDTGWLQVGGTSLSTPLVTGMLVRSGQASKYSSAQPLYAHRDLFHDIVRGANGSCGKDSLCTAKKGWDAPTGVGTPRSLHSF